MSQAELFSDEEVYDPAFNNPMVVQFGKGPEEKCKTCTHLYYRDWGKRYYKCKLHGDTHGPGTDHRVNFHACRMYEREDIAHDHSRRTVSTTTTNEKSSNKGFPRR